MRGVEDAAYAIRLGYQRIAIIAGTQFLTPGRERLRGCYEAFDEMDIRVDPALIKIGNFRLESGYELTREFMSMAEPPDAIFAASNL